MRLRAKQISDVVKRALPFGKVCVLSRASANALHLPFCFIISQICFKIEDFVRKPCFRMRLRAEQISDVVKRTLPFGKVCVLSHASANAEHLPFCFTISRFGVLVKAFEQSRFAWI